MVIPKNYTDLPLAERIMYKLADSGIIILGRTIDEQKESILKGRDLVQAMLDRELMPKAKRV